jgi:hypothetical protein
VTSFISPIGSTAGEWLQIQSSDPKVLSSFSLGLGPNPWPYTTTPATYYIVGSTDGSSWYPVQSGIFSISNFFISKTVDSLFIKIIKDSKKLSEVRDGFIKYLNLPVIYDFAMSKNLLK